MRSTFPTPEQRSIFDALPFGVAVQSPDGRLIYTNDMAARLLGYARSQTAVRAGNRKILAKFTIFDDAGNPFPPERLPGQLTLKTNKPYEAVIRFRRNGTSRDRWAKIRSAAIRSPDGSLLGILNAITDYTTLEYDRLENRERQERENTLKLALDVARMGLWDWNIVTDEFNWSDGTVPVGNLGKGRYSGTLEKFLNHIYPEDREDVRRLIMQAKRERGKFEAEFRIPGKPGTRWMYKRGEVLTDGRGRAVRMIGVGIDISNRKETEALIVRSGKKFKAIFDSAVDGMVITNAGLSIIEANSAALRYFAQHTETIIGAKLPNLLDPASRQTFSETWNNAGRATSHRGELVMNTRSGEKKFFEYSARTGFLPDRHLFVFHDITSRVEEEQRREHLLGLTSHELRTPLASIKAFIALLDRRLSGADSRIREYLKKIDEKTDAVTLLVRDLLDVSRIRDNRFEMYYETFPFDQFLTELLEDLQMTAPTHRITVTGKTGTVIRADRHRLTQVFTNIIRNAVRYSPGKDRVEVRAEKKSSRILVSIRDHGIGIAKKDFKNVFRLFYKADTDTRTRIYGIGVGLYIAKTIVEQHGGSIWVDSKIGTGSVFYVSLPIKSRRQSVQTGTAYA